MSCTRAISAIPVYKPRISEREKRYVLDCLDSSWISSKGKYISLFEEKFAEFIAAEHAVSVFNGTVALHLALLALRICEKDEVLVPSLTYVASANAIKYCGAKPVFVDACKKTWQIDPQDLVKRITPRSRAIMVVHLYGYPCDMDAICKIAKEHNLAIIEDCAEAFGTFYKGKHVGVFGDVATFSFFGNKTITCGEGGMVVTAEQKLAERMRHLKNQAASKSEGYFHDCLGYNYRMTNIQAAIGLAQLEQADEILEAKSAIFYAYKKALPTLTFLGEDTDIKNSFWMCSGLAKDAKQLQRIRSHLKEHEVESRPFFTPCHLLPHFKGRKGDFPIAEKLSSCGINLPSYPDLTEEEIDYICGLIKEVL